SPVENTGWLKCSGIRISYLVEGHFWSAIREKYAGKYSCTHKSTSASHEEMDIISQKKLNLKAHVSFGFLIQTP
ncbi:hypothetical protein, partial [Klebsiella pneumoniae]|uniref:hypothetical protein n=1 Tax=Klebsiella pneumoniae TaxID=573 RepID=UPI001C6A1D01